MSVNDDFILHIGKHKNIQNAKTGIFKKDIKSAFKHLNI